MHAQAVAALSSDVSTRCLSGCSESIVADRTIPYGLLLSVMFSAKEKEAGYKRFRLIVQKGAIVPAPGG